jgi:hypothetical protein
VHFGFGQARLAPRRLGACGRQRPAILVGPRGPSLRPAARALARRATRCPRGADGHANAETTTLIAPAGLRCRRSGASVAATRYAEIIEPTEPDTGVLAEHTVDWLAGCPAVTRHPLGGGSVLHCGTGLNDAVLEWLWREPLSCEHHGARSQASPLSLPTPLVSLSNDAAEVLTRRNHETALHFVLNHRAVPVICELRRLAHDLPSARAGAPFRAGKPLTSGGHSVSSCSKATVDWTRQ